jgi:hypothetical protein
MTAGFIAAGFEPETIKPAVIDLPLQKSSKKEAGNSG